MIRREINQEYFFKLVDDAVALNLENQLRFENNKKFISGGQWLSDFGTVNLNVGRQVGKTNYIATRMTTSDLVIVPYERDVKNYYHKAADLQDKLFFNSENVYSARIMFDRFNMSGYWRGRRDLHENWNKVYVDEPNMVFAQRDSFYEFYDWFGKRCNQVIMLGTAVKR